MDETKLLRKVCQGNQIPLLQEEEFPEQLYLKREKQSVIRQALLSMEHPDREIFLRHYYYYQTVTCIADEMNLSPSSIKSRLARGRQKLKKYLHKGGYFNEDNRMDGYELYLQLRIEAPEGTKLTGHDRNKKSYCLFSDDKFTNHFPGYEGSWSQGDTYYLDKLYNDAVDSEEKENEITMTLHYTFDENGSATQMPKVFHFEGLWTQDTNKEYVKVLDGSWDIPLDHIMIKDQVIKPQNK